MGCCRSGDRREDRRQTSAERSSVLPVTCVHAFGQRLFGGALTFGFSRWAVWAFPVYLALRHPCSDPRRRGTTTGSQRSATGPRHLALPNKRGRFSVRAASILSAFRLP